MMTKQTKFILAMALQIVIIFAIIIFKLAVLAGGTDVLLLIAPVDPKDFLRGDYATFQYDISNVYYYEGGQQIRNGDTVYVVLHQNGKYWMSQNVQKTRPAEKNLFIKGKVESGGLEGQSDPSSKQSFNSYHLHIVYGIEQYFIPEGKGRNFSFWNKKAAARVVIDDSGNAVLKQVYINDKPWP
jgi:uncharacterized membrane-anchored protein